ncbi:hypothetical protein [Streptomyces sviceus]|uniref:hypothetical protein n=1 Tax=Streptomyces sviceus TaxID=285530 RepID=UPI0036F018A3
MPGKGGHAGPCPVYGTAATITDAELAALLAPGGFRFLRRLVDDDAGRRFVPELTVMSLDGRLLMNTPLWGDGTVSTIVICPSRLLP